MKNLEKYFLKNLSKFSTRFASNHNNIPLNLGTFNEFRFIPAPLTERKKREKLFTKHLKKTKKQKKRFNLFQNDFPFLYRSIRKKIY